MKRNGKKVSPTCRGGNLAVVGEALGIYGKVAEAAGWIVVDRAVVDDAVAGILIALQGSARRVDRQIGAESQHRSGAGDIFVV